MIAPFQGHVMQLTRANENMIFAFKKLNGTHSSSEDLLIRNGAKNQYAYSTRIAFAFIFFFILCIALVT